jgi:F-type H+-transporting ATPase subunit a
MEETFPQVVFTVLGVGVRDTVTSTWATMAIILAASYLVRCFKPTLFYMLFDFLSDTTRDLMGRPAEPYLPFIGALAIFVAFANTISFIPFIKSATTDINTAIALAVVVFFAVHYFGIQDQGFVGYFKDLASPVFLLPMEIMGQVSRTASLALRLFGNVVSTQLIVDVVASLIPVIAPLIPIGLNMFTGMLQSYIFISLAAVYISTALGAEE